MQKDERKAWTTPTLREFGSFAALTQQDKKFGSSDGFTLMGVSITNNGVS